eukprot:CAMPEP_0195009868 /NCGR_PEP_ID=MMETSP0326_2-20130528/9653_1 /TAXON_ID=2866 ORGANISM="Crypthecodinium cohnii, Strain Seligo" /NCGR_SAMPLE_ID=MMETSP0326_2 /ASSEMBLY_ACC=CAM_ASM_000348 /LENGTH=120 /DNA_ID=CAMNT_0040018283 /DNA_START=314 /DNA_END=673 /DNA_ORIENTATION=-
MAKRWWVQPAVGRTQSVIRPVKQVLASNKNWDLPGTVWPQTSQGPVWSLPALRDSQDTVVCSPRQSEKPCCIEILPGLAECPEPQAQPDEMDSNPAHCRLAPIVPSVSLTSKTLCQVVLE